MGRGEDGAALGTLGWEAEGAGMAAGISTGWGYHRLVPADFKLLWSIITPQAESVLLSVLCPTPLSHSESSCPYDPPPFVCHPLQLHCPYGPYLCTALEELLHREGSSPTPTSPPFCPATPNSEQHRAIGFCTIIPLRELLFLLSQGLKNSFLGRKSGRSTGGCMELSCPCPALLVHTMMNLNLPWGPAVRVEVITKISRY